MRVTRAFTLVEAVVLLAVFAIMLAAAIVVLPGILGHSSRGIPRSTPNNTHLRGIHQSMVMYAQGNNGYFPGLGGKGEDKAVAVEDRLRILLEHNYFTGEYAISPSEAKTAWTTGPLTTAQYSYALLQIPATEDAGRRGEWRETLNTEAIALTDRAIVTDGQLHSVHTKPGEGWRGSVVYNDNHVVFESTHVLATAYTVGEGEVARHKEDDLFRPAGDDDAWFIHSGNR